MRVFKSCSRPHLMSLYRRKNSPYWYIDLRRKGKRVRHPTGTANKAEAQRVHDKLAHDLWEEAQLGTPAGYTWLQAANEWLQAAPRGKPDRYSLRWIEKCWGDPALLGITGGTLSDLFRAMRFKGSAPGTIQRNINLVRAILNGAKTAGWLASVPLMPAIETPPGRLRWLTHEEWGRLDPLLPLHLRQLARFTLATGLRRHNATHLRWTQVDLTRKVAWIQAEDMKQRQALGIPLNQWAMKVLSAQQGLHSEWVFPYRGHPVFYTATRAWREALAAAEIADFTWHDLRHTWASWHMMNGTRIDELQKLGGWKTLTMVMRYAHLAPQHLAGIAENVRPDGVPKMCPPYPEKGLCDQVWPDIDAVRQTISN